MAGSSRINDVDDDDDDDDDDHNDHRDYEHDHHHHHQHHQALALKLHIISIIRHFSPITNIKPPLITPTIYNTSSLKPSNHTTFLTKPYNQTLYIQTGVNLKSDHHSHQTLSPTQFSITLH